jgi:hypothetical protein
MFKGDSLESNAEPASRLFIFFKLVEKNNSWLDYSQDGGDMSNTISEQLLERRETSAYGWRAKKN